MSRLEKLLNEIESDLKKHRELLKQYSAMVHLHDHTTLAFERHSGEVEFFD